MVISQQDLAEYDQAYIDQLRHEFGLDRSIMVQYFDWMAKNDIKICLTLDQLQAGSVKVVWNEDFESHIDTHSTIGSRQERVYHASQGCTGEKIR